jgi:ABC-type branched-subunit amino acid transport system substrate-binding protein
VYDPSVFDPKYNWLWNTGAGLTLYPAIATWVAEHNPKLKTYVVACPDRMDGKIAGEIHTVYARAGGLKAFDPIYYPPSATDLSAIGTQIKQLNPDILDVHGGGPPMDATVLKAAYGAGWRGQAVASATAPGSVMMGIAGPDATEGMLGIGWSFEFDPPATALGKEWRADYIAKFGKFEDTEPVLAYTYFCLKEALKKAGSIENTKVKAVLDAGFTFESPLGTSQRVNRPLSNNLRMVDHTAGNVPVKQIKQGKIVQIDFLTLEQSVKYYYQVYGKK